MLYSSKSKRSPSEVWLALTARPHSLRGASPYRGVQKANSNPALPWRAMLRFNGRVYNAGSFATQEEAALAWNQLALRIVGPEAQPRLNHIPNSNAA
jgi:hypothetical protein